MDKQLVVEEKKRVQVTFPVALHKLSDADVNEVFSVTNAKYSKYAIKAY